jgi:hypothetical protein
MALQRCDQLVHVFFQQVRPYDKHYFIASLHVVSKLSILQCFGTKYLVFSCTAAAAVARCLAACCACLFATSGGLHL